MTATVLLTLPTNAAPEGGGGGWGGSGVFLNSGQSLGNLPSSSVVLGDVDNDGDLDALVGNWGQINQIWFNDGSGHFTDSGQALGVGNTMGVALGDLDNDGDLDAYIANGYGAEYDYVWFNNGAGVFTDSGQEIGPTVSKAVALGDLDDDGDLDAFIGNWGGTDKVYFNDGNGFFTESSQIFSDVSTWVVALGDLDGDGDLDAFLGTDWPSANEVWLNNGAGQFSKTTQNLGVETARGVAIGDMDGDGDLDIFIANARLAEEPHGVNHVWFNYGNGLFSDSGQMLGDNHSNGVVLGDVDGDGDLDALLTNNWGWPNQVWMNDSSGIYTDSGQELMDGMVEAFRLAMGDVDRDNDLDVFFANNGPNSVWLNSDQIPLLPPRYLTARSGLDAVLLTWEPSQTGGIEGYHVYRQTTGELNFTRLTSTPLTGLSYRDESAQDGMTYAYYVTAVAPAGTESDPSNIAQVTFGQLNLVIPDTYAAPGELVQVPVNIENADGLCIAAMDIGILYDDQVATAVAVHSTALTTGYTFVDTLRHPDEVHISSIGNCQGLYGPGSLFLVDFQVAAGVTVDSSLDFVRGLTGTVIYDNGNLLTPVPLTLVDGRLLLGSQYVRGDINGDTAVNAADAALALQIAAGVITPTSDQRLAGDVNGDGVINAADSSMILYYAAYQTWPPVGALAAMSLESTTTTIYVTPGRVTAVSGAEIEVPVSLNDAANLAGGTVVLRYGEDLTYLSTRLDDTLSAAHFQLRTHTPTPGEVRLSLAGRTNLSGSEQEIVWLRFRVKAAASEANTWVEVTGAWLNDLNGRDFSLSALQKNVYGGVGGVGLGHEIYLPVVIRP